MDMSWLLAKNSSGQPDTMLTFSWVAFVVVLFKVIFGGMSFKLGQQNIAIAVIDPATIGALLTPTLGAYVIRRYTDRKFIDANNNGINDADEEKK